MRKAVGQRAVGLFVALERLVYRHGYLRVLAGSISMLGILGVSSLLLGISSLRTLFAGVVGLFLALAGGIEFERTKKLRDRLDEYRSLIHAYADAVQSKSPLVVRKWRQVVTIERNGDASVRREHILASAGADGFPHTWPQVS